MVQCPDCGTIAYGYELFHRPDCPALKRRPAPPTSRMRRFKVRVREVLEIPFPEIEIEAANEEMAEALALDAMRNGDLGGSLLENATGHYAVDIRDA